MKNTIKKVLFFVIAYLLMNTLNAQRKSVNISQFDPRFTISAQKKWGVGNEEYFFYVQNNTSDEYKMVINVTLDLACVGQKSFTLGINKIVYLKPNGKFDAFKDDWVHIYNSGADNFKDCRLKDGNSFTLFQGVSYQVSSLVNVTQEKAATEKKKQQEELARQQKLEAEKKKREEEKAQKEAQTKADAEKRKQEQAKKEAQAKADADKKKQEEAKTDKAKTSSQASSTTAAKTSTSNSGSTTTANKKTSSEEQAEQRRAAAERERVAKQQAKEEEERKQREEQEKLNKKQAEYDQWKSNAQSRQNASDAASAGAFGILMVVMGEWIYNENMGKVNPEYSFQRTKKPVQFGVGLDYGYSLSSFPMLFSSDKTTMVNGSYRNTKEIQAKNPFIINFDPTFKMGAENNNFGGFGYVGIKIGSSPIFDGDQFSVHYGARAYAGINWVKAYADFGFGSRIFNKSSSDVEEYGSGKSNVKFSKLEYGLRFTTHPEDDLRRSHIYLGIMSEKLTLADNNRFINPLTGTLSSLNETPAISGFSLQWHKEHTFKLYANFYPEYIFTGETSTSTLDSDFKTTKTGSFIEFGFVRAINWWIN